MNLGFYLGANFLAFDLACTDARDHIYRTCAMGKMLTTLNVFLMDSSPAVSFHSSLLFRKNRMFRIDHQLFRVKVVLTNF